MNTEPKAKLTASSPVLLVKDVVAAANYYRDTMGFSYNRFWGEPPNFVILERDGMYVMLRQAEDPKHVVPHWTVADKLWNIYFWVSDVDALYEEFKSRGAKIDYGLCDQPYGCREFGTQDLDGHDIGFGKVVE
ncbi:VOC family protein [Pelagicoccus sp. NFK12]|uniref:VOC family protein n=1 Tax=Pelagicoccus enzymogenes TaxID=2773457 RepID=A0A927FCM2_9BACT|nr:VOC family protein [Pelagicoccus enzymogenes]MBD5781250.1 VOC family protein [Pelagicoccus enzymogenes]MDQ8198847.1 VOC family protein [Pelagicoccus enzymogenes]